MTEKPGYQHPKPWRTANLRGQPRRRVSTEPCPEKISLRLPSSEISRLCRRQGSPPENCPSTRQKPSCSEQRSSPAANRCLTQQTAPKSPPRMSHPRTGRIGQRPELAGQ